jgi:hypothetical protein
MKIVSVLAITQVIGITIYVVGLRSAQKRTTEAVVHA